MPSAAGRFSTLTVLRYCDLLVEVDRHQAVEVVAEVAGHADRLDEALPA